MEPGDPFHSVRNVPRSGPEQTRAWDAYNRTWSPGSFVPRHVRFAPSTGERPTLGSAAMHLDGGATSPRSSCSTAGTARNGNSASTDARAPETRPRRAYRFLRRPRPREAGGVGARRPLLATDGRGHLSRCNGSLFLAHWACPLWQPRSRRRLPALEASIEWPHWKCACRAIR